jgi:methylamine dehydrogenase accessory protein MauD
MASVGLGARVALALVFTVAAVGKLADQGGTRTALRDFRTPEWVVAPLALTLPLAELLTATALLIQPTARGGAVAALALLAAFGAGIAAAMIRGEAPDCHCFGQLHSEPAGRGTLIRNALVAVPAVFLLAYGQGTPVDSWLPSHATANVLALIAAVAALALAAFILQLTLQNRRLRRDLRRVQDATEHFPAGPPVGAPAPQFSLPDVDGQMVTFGELLSRGRPVAMVFVSPDCGPCQLMFPAIAGWQRRLAHRITIVLVGRGPARELRAYSEPYGLQNVLVDCEREVIQAYRTSVTPSAVIVNADGTVGSALRSTTPIIEALIRRALAEQGDGPPRRGAVPASAAADGDVEVVQWVAPARA